MNILFLTIGRLNNIEDHGLYTDLLRVFREKGHAVYTVSSREKRLGRVTEYVQENGIHALRVKIGNITQCSTVEKGLSTVAIEMQYLRAVKRYLDKIRFDLVLYSTPPITLAGVVSYIRKRDGARTYLLLKDIFPQNAVDLGMLTKTGPKSVLYHLFRQKEKQLYVVSDHIGCMSPANVRYLLQNNPEIPSEKVEVCPNSVEVQDYRLDEEAKRQMRLKYGIPLDRTVFVYGGNLGKPQGIPFLIECLETQKNNPDAFFLIVGDGTEYPRLRYYFNQAQPQNMKLMQRLPKDDYDRMIAACDVGLIFLDHRFTIPNFPSRLLSYMQAGLPVLACTDPHTDIGKVITEGSFGWWCESNDISAFTQAINSGCSQNLHDMGDREYQFLKTNYSARTCYYIIWKSLSPGRQE